MVVWYQLGRDLEQSLAYVNPCVLRSHFEPRRVFLIALRITYGWMSREPPCSSCFILPLLGCAMKLPESPVLPSHGNSHRHTLLSHEAGSGPWKQKSESTCRDPRELIRVVCDFRTGQVCIFKKSFYDSLFIQTMSLSPCFSRRHL